MTDKKRYQNDGEVYDSKNDLYLTDEKWDFSGITNHLNAQAAEIEALHDRIENLEAQIAILTSDPFPKLPPIEDMTND